MDKKQILGILALQIEEDLKNLRFFAQSERKAAQEAPGAMESRYDTTKGEKQALLHALSQPLEDLERAVREIHSFVPSPCSEVELGALLEVVIQEKEGEKKGVYFVAPPGTGGKTVVLEDGTKVQTVTWQAPLTQKLKGKKAGDLVSVSLPSGDIAYTIVSIQ